MARRIREDEQNKRVTFFAVGVKGADEDCLRQISVRPHKMLSGVKFRELFLWLSSSMKSVSHSTPGEMVALDNSGTWEAV